VLDIPYPGGPGIDKLSDEGNPEAIHFPRVMLENDSYDFSFSGLKSAVLNYINKAKMTGEQINRADVAASFQAAVIDVLVEKAVRACKTHGINRLAMAGGVSANKHLRAAMQAACDENGIQMCVPKPVLCTDNAAMIGSAAYYELINGNTAGMELNAYPNLKLGEKAEIEHGASVLELADAIADKIINNQEYIEYRAAMDRLQANPELYRRVQDYKKRMFNFITARQSNHHSFDEEKYLSQEYYKIILNKDAETYFENGLRLMSLFEEVVGRSICKCILDVFAED
jgi:predicted NodU family carbamoyl transferase